MPHEICAGAFERLGVNGVALARGADVLGIRILYPEISLGFFDGREAIYSMDDTFCEAPDLAYVRYAWRIPVSHAGLRRFGSTPRTGTNYPLVYDYAPGESAYVKLEWHFDGTVASGRVSVDAAVELAVLANGCFAPAVIEDTTVSNTCALRQGNTRLTLRMEGQLEPPVAAEDLDHAERIWFGEDKPRAGGIVLHGVYVDPASPLYFSCRLGEARDAPEYPPLEPEAVDRALAAGRERYAARRMRSTGFCDGAAEAVASLAGYGRHYDPVGGREQTAVNRTWAGPNKPGGAFCWDNFFTTYIAAWENPRLARSSLRHILSIYAGGWMRPDVPPQRNCIIPVLACRTLELLDDEALSREAWPVLMGFMRCWFADRGDGIPWRDPNGDGLIEPGSCYDPAVVPMGKIIQNAMDETGYDEIPIYSDGFMDGRRGLLAEGVAFDSRSRCLGVTLVGQNSLYVSSCRIMARMADRLGFAGDAAWLRAEEERVRGAIRERLFCAEDGIFRDRLGGGGFSPVKAMTVFYPLLAELADETTAQNLRRMLLDPEQFWGENVIPTVSRDDPAYCDGLDKRGNYWRGNPWPPTTYIVYLAIKEAGWDNVAAAYAARTVGQFLRYWRGRGHAYENYPPEGEETFAYRPSGGWGGRELRYVWSAMMLLCGLEEIFAPEVMRAGLRFGNPYLPDRVTWNGFRYGKDTVEAEAGRERTRVRCGAAWEIRVEPGAVVRGFVHGEAETRFDLRAGEDATVRFEAAALKPGASVVADDVPVASVFEEGAVRFTLSAGERTVCIRHG